MVQMPMYALWCRPQLRLPPARVCRTDHLRHHQRAGVSQQTRPTRDRTPATSQSCLAANAAPSPGPHVGFTSLQRHPASGHPPTITHRDYRRRASRRKTSCPPLHRLRRLPIPRRMRMRAMASRSCRLPVTPPRLCKIHRPCKMRLPKQSPSPASLATLATAPRCRRTSFRAPAALAG